MKALEKGRERVLKALEREWVFKALEIERVLEALERGRESFKSLSDLKVRSAK